MKTGTTLHAETVEVKYDDEMITLTKLLEHYLRFVDPYSVNRQGEDIGSQYRTGVFYVDETDKDIIKSYFDNNLKVGYRIEIEKLTKFFKAEEYHQDYLKKNPNGYCHINLNLIEKNEKKN